MIRLLLVALLVMLLFGWASPPMSATARRRFKRLTFGVLLAFGVIMLLRAGLITFTVLGIGLLLALRLSWPALIRFMPALKSRNSTSFFGQVPPSPPFASSMTREQALKVLNLVEGASRDEILTSYRELIRKVHPDRGGSSYLAAEVNRARDVLLD